MFLKFKIFENFGNFEFLKILNFENSNFEILVEIDH